MGDMQYVYLFGSQKLVYMRSRWFLPPSHRYRKLTKEFNGTEERGRAPKHLDGKLVFELVKNIRVVFGRRWQRVRRVLRKGRRLLRVMIRQRRRVVTRNMQLGSRSFRFSLSTYPTGRI